MTKSAGDTPRRARRSTKQARSASGPPAGKPPHRLGLPVSPRVKLLDQPPVVFTVGHSTRTSKEFVALLLALMASSS